MPVEGPRAPASFPPLTSKRISVSLERASRGPLSHVPNTTRQALVEALQCLICLDVLQLPVSITCFPNCPGTHARANNTCLRGSLCQHCANEALQLDRPPAERFPEEGGKVRCMICRVTTADARLLSPVRAYVVNHVLMDVMDSVDIGASCRKCEREFESQAALQAHYLKACPHAVVQCRFKGCAQVGVRTHLERHQDTCSLGRAVCQQCQEWVDKDELVYHMVTQCRMRVVVCILCNHRACLPDMLLHLRLHQAQLQLKMMRQVPAALPSGGQQQQQAQQQLQRSTMSQAVAATLRADLNLIPSSACALHGRAPAAGTAAEACSGSGRGYATCGGATAAAVLQPSVTAAVASTIGPLSPRRPATPQSRSYPAAAGHDRPAPAAAAAMAALLLTPPPPLPPAASAPPHLPPPDAADAPRSSTPGISGVLRSSSPSSGALSQAGWRVYDLAPGSSSSSSSSSSSRSRPSSSSGASAELGFSPGPGNSSNVVDNDRSSSAGGRCAAEAGDDAAAPGAAPPAPPGPGPVPGPLGESQASGRPGSALTLVSTSILPANQHQMLFEMLQRLRAYKQQQGQQPAAPAAATPAGEPQPSAAGAPLRQPQQQPVPCPPSEPLASTPSTPVRMPSSSSDAAAVSPEPSQQLGLSSDGTASGSSAEHRLRSLPVVLIDRSYLRGQSSGCAEHTPSSPPPASESGGSAEGHGWEGGGGRRSSSGSVASPGRVPPAATSPLAASGGRSSVARAAAAAAALALAPPPFQLQRRAAQSLDLPRRRRRSDSHALETSRYELAAASQAVALPWLPGGAM